MFALPMVSCEREEAGGEVVAETDTTTVQIQFTLNVAGGGMATKAGTWGDGYTSTTANDFESKIASLQVLAFPHNTTAPPCVAEDVSHSGGIVTCKMQLDGSFFVDGDITKNFNGVVVVAANYGTTLSESTTYSDFISGVTFANEGGFTYGNLSSTGMPMWGFKDYNSGISLNRGSYTEIGEIPMLRSLAKLRVSLYDEDAKTHELRSAALGGKWCSTGYLAANFKSGENYFAYETINYIQIEASQHPYTSDDGFGNSSVTMEKDGDAYYIYLPEAKYPKDGKNATVTLTYTDGDETKEKTFNIDTYTDGKATGGGIDIIRNTVYDYVISLDKVEVSLMVLPWEVTTSSIGWNLQGDETAGIDPVLYAWNQDQMDEKVTAKENGATVYYYDTPDVKDATKGDSEAKYCYVSYPRYETIEKENDHVSDKRSGAEFYFLITAPEGAMWEAHLTNTDDFEFETRALDGNKWDWLYFDTETKQSTTEQHYPVSVGIARSNIEYAAGETNASSSYQVRCCRPYKIIVKPKHAWYTSDATKDDDGNYTYDAGKVTLTEYGEKWENAKEEDGTYKYKDADGNVVGGPYTDLYITVSTSGKESDDYRVDINPQYDEGELTSYYHDADENKYYRFAPGVSTGQSIRIWQLKATNKKDSDMAADNKDNEFFTTQ